MTLEYLQGLHAAYEDFIADSACAGLGACGGAADLRKSSRNPQIRVAIPTASAGCHAALRDCERYTELVELCVELCSASCSSNAFA